jgi:hypothetical protein
MNFNTVLDDKGLSAAEIIFKDEHPLTNIVTFHCQQTIEKYLNIDVLVAIY